MAKKFNLIWKGCIEAVMRMIFRAEPKCLAIYNIDRNKSAKIQGKNLVLMEEWLKTGQDNSLSDLLVKEGILEIPLSDQHQEELKKLVDQCQEVTAPPRSLIAPEILNIELTSRCPLRCPQCYCDLYRGKDIAKETAFAYIEQAAALKEPYINLSGGETLVYPHLTDLLAFIRAKGLSSAIAISGWGLDAAKLAELKNAGVDQIYVSLNGSSKEVNDKSRAGYELAINALRLLQHDGQVNYYINWVARDDNVQDFPNLVELAKGFGVQGIVILGSKPDASFTMQSALSKENFLLLAEYLKKHDQREIKIEIESCFSPLRAYRSNSFLWNSNVGVSKGCGAGRDGLAIDVDGNLQPCRHLLHPEKFASIKDYWENSELLKQLRSFEDNRGEPCQSCYLRNNCVPCLAVADKVEHNLFSGNKYCALAPTV